MSNSSKQERVPYSVGAGQTIRIPMDKGRLVDKSVVTASVKSSDNEVTFWWTWGDLVDQAGSLPHGHPDNPSTCEANKSKSLVMATAGAPEQAELAIHNAGGSTATGFVNMSTRAHS